MLFLNRDEVDRLLTHDRCIAACEEGLIAQAAGEASEIPRITLDAGATYLLLMPSMISTQSRHFVGLRSYNIEGPLVSTARGVRLMYILWDGGTGEPLAIMDALWIRDRRTAAIGALGTKLVARSDSRTIGVIGSGRQARSGLVAQTRVMKYTRCQVFSPNNAHATLYADEMSELLEIDIVPVGTAEEAVIGADVVLAASAVNSPHENPVLQGAWLEPGMHVASIGGRAELDDAVVTRCDAIVIDSKSQFPHECFDVTSQVERGLLAWDDVAELHEVIAGNRIGRRSLDDITLVKTVGTPLQDLLPAVVTYEAARKEGCGTDLGDAFPPSGGWYV